MIHKQPQWTANRWRMLVMHLCWLAATLLAPGTSFALDTICARVKIQIDQKLTLERQGFDAMMRITNTLDTVPLGNLAVQVLFTDEVGLPVLATSDPNDLNASFFIRIDSMTGVNDVSGNGTVQPASIAEVHWLIIPSPGAAGTTPAGKLYFVGANLSYTVGGEPQTIKVSPDSVIVQPVPRLTLDYFLTQDVFADDPFTPAIEPAVPFTLGVRARNGGAASAKKVKIESAQPRITENLQGLLIGFRIDGSFVNDAAVTPSLLVDLGDVAPAAASTGRWLMTTSLSGKFTEFSASFTHSDALGGALTSLIDATNAHLLLRDVKVDLPGRDSVRDFLALDDSILRVYESSGVDTVVTDQSTVATLTPGGGDNFLLSSPPVAGLIYMRLPDPANGTQDLGRITRSDGKTLSPENAWLSKTRATPGGPFDFWINVFDANSTGNYTVVLTAAAATPRPPVLQSIAAHTAHEGQLVSFLVEASDPDGTLPTLTTSPLPTGAHFTPQPTTDNVARALFDWTPATGQAGQYPITFTASDGALSTAITAPITVTTQTPPAGPDTPVIARPQVATVVKVLAPELAIAASANPLDTAVSYQFEIYGDAGFADLIAQNPLVARTANGAAWQVPVQLGDNTNYYWRVRAFDGATYSTWTLGRFFVSIANDAPTAPVIAAPATGTSVDTLSPTLSVTNSNDPDAEDVNYRFEVYADSALTQKLRETPNLAAGANGVTSAVIAPALTDQTLYYWRAIAIDPHGATTASATANFQIDVNHPAPGAPTIVTPVRGAVVTSAALTLTVANGTHGPSVSVHYFFELDRNDTFTSASLVRSAAIAEGQDQTVFGVTGLVENAHYFWRSKASDGLAESAWVYGDFTVDQTNDAPSAPTLLNPGQGAFVTTRQPLLEIGPSLDPEGDTLAYHFQVYSDEALANLVVERVTDATTWRVQPPLSDEATYFWRARAEDARDAFSDWSAPQSFSVHVGVPSPPGLTLVEPANVVTLTDNTASIDWEIDDPEHTATLALFYDRDASGEDGTLIAADIAQDANANTGSFAWDVSTLLPGTYFVYASASNRGGVTTRYAPGAFIVPVPQPRGSIVITPTTPLQTTETGGTATFTVALGNSPKSDVTIGFTTSHPQEARLDPRELTFGPANWNVPRTVTVQGLSDCVDDGDQTYQVVPGQASSTDADYNGVQAAALTLVNRGSTEGCQVNSAPIVDAGAAQTVNEATVVTLNGSATDSDGTVTSVLWTQTAGPIVTLVNANALSASFTAPAVDADTVLSFRLTATDNQGATASDTVDVTVRNVIANTPPIVNVGAAQTVNEKTAVTLAGKASDPDGTIASFLWTQASGPTVSLSGANTDTVSFTAPEVASSTVLTFTFTVTDNGGATTSASTTVTVNNVNQPPTANAGPNLLVVEGAPVTIKGGSSDPDGDITSFRWTRIAGPAIVLNGATTPTVSFTAPLVALDTVLTLQFTVRDEQGATGTDTVDILIRNNRGIP